MKSSAKSFLQVTTASMTTIIPLGLPGFLYHNLKVVDAGIEFEAEATLNYPFCRACGVRSTSIHSHYQRHIYKLHLNGKAMYKQEQPFRAIP